MADKTPPGSGLKPLLDQLKQIRTRLGVLESLDGTQKANVVAQLQALIADFQAELDAYIAGLDVPTAAEVTAEIAAALAAAMAGPIAPASIDAAGHVNGGDFHAFGNLDVDGEAKFPNAYVTDVTWTRVAGWIGDDGRLGYASSQASKKHELNAASFDLAALDALQVVHFQYNAELAKQAADPGHHVSTNIGMYAEDLHNAGLWEFVIYSFAEDDTERANPIPKGIHYELLALLLIPLMQQQQAQIITITERLDAAGI